MLLKSFSTAKFAESKIEVCVLAAVDFSEVVGVDLNTGVPKKDKVFDCEVLTSG